MNQIERLNNELSPLRNRLLHHPLYTSIHSIDAIQVFMQEHVFAVWDFMSLLKALQNGLTCTSTPWVPKGNPVTRKLINEIVLGEETDVNELGEVKSHFEMYVEAMSALGASTTSILDFTNSVAANKADLTTLLEQTAIHPSTKAFVAFTMDCVKNKPLHIIAAVFTFGREDLIPDMFIEIVKSLPTNATIDTSKLLYYLERHIEVDGGEHGPMSLQMIQELCGDDTTKWNEAIDFAKKAMEQRIQLWDGVLEKIQLME